MSDLWQDRDFNFGVSEEEEIEIEIPIRNRRFSRSVYCKESGEYVGEVGPFIPRFLCYSRVSLFRPWNIRISYSNDG